MTQPSGFVRAFLSSALGTGLSRVLGLVRDIVLSNVLGAGVMNDAFQLAFTIPNAFRRFVADEGLTGALIPTLAATETEHGPERARALANASFTVLMLVCSVICVVGMLQPEWLVWVFAAPEWREVDLQRNLAEDLTRIMMPLLLLVTMTSFLEGLLNLKGHFFAPKIAPGLISAGIVGGILLFGNDFALPVYAAAWGVGVGGIVHVLVNVPWVIKLWGVLRPSLQWGLPGVGRLMNEMGKVVLIGLAAQANLIILRQLTTSIETGSLTQYWYATRLVDLAQGVIAIAVGSALLPVISRAVANEDWGRFQRSLTSAIRLLSFVLIPTAVALSTFALPLVAILFRHGDFTFEAVRSTASALPWFTPFMLSVGAIAVFKKVYFSLDQRTTLLVVGLVGVALTGAIGWPLTRMYGVPGVSAALSISTVLQLIIYMAILKIRLGDHMALRVLVGPLTRMTLAALCMAPFLLWIRGYGDWIEGPLLGRNWAVFLGGAIGGALLYIAASALLRIEELDELTRRLRRRH